MNPSELTALLRLLISDRAAFKRELSRHASLTLFASNLAVQVITVGFAPILSRLYAPESFGVVGAISALVLVVVPLTTLRYEYAIPSCKTDIQAKAVLCVCGITVLATLPLLLLAALGVPRVVDSVAHLKPWIYCVPLIAAAMGIYESLALEATRRSLLQTLAATRMTQAAAGLVVQLAFGFFAFGTVGLIAGLTLNLAAGSLSLLRPVRQARSDEPTLTWGHVREALVVNKAYPLYSSWSSVLDAASRWSLQVALTVCWSPRAGGYMYLAERTIGRPLTMLSTALYPVYVSRFRSVQTTNPSGLRALYHHFLVRQLIATLPAVGATVVLAPLFIAPLFGQEWAEAVPFVQLGSLSLAPSLILYPVSLTPQMAGRQRAEAVIVVLRVAWVVMAFGVCLAWQASALQAVGAFAVVQLVVGLTRYFVHLKILADLRP